MSKHVHDLDATTFQPFVDSHDVVLLAILMLPQSEKSRDLVPVLSSMAESSTEPTVVFAQLNVNDSWDAVASFGITTFPQLVLFRGWSDWRVYKGVFGPTSIIAYLGRFLQFPVITAVDAATLEAFKSGANSDVVVVGYTTAPDADSTASSRFQNVAKALYPEFVFGETHDLALARAEGVIDGPALVVYNNATGERSTFLLTSTTDQRELEGNVRKAALPLVVDLYPEIHDALLDLGTPFAYTFTPTATSSPPHLPTDDLSSLARKYRGKIQFSTAPISRVPAIALDMHLASTPLPAFGIREPASNLRYPMLSPSPEISFTVSVEEFVHDFLANTLQPTIKSEPIPFPSPSSPSALVKVVGATYHAIVDDPNRDVLLTVCIEQCAPCARLYPVLEELAEMYAEREREGNGGETKTTVATVLYDLNDTGLRGIRAFPTILLFRAGAKGQKKAVRFLGERTVEMLSGFIEREREEGSGA